MAGKGGLQRPTNPAPVSGPGALARRTDGGPTQPLRHLPNAQYGEDKTFYAEQQAAPLPAQPQPSSSGNGPVPQAAEQPDMSMVTPIGAPSQRPNEPVTAGARLGPGAGAESLGLPDPDVQAYLSASQFIKNAAARSTDPMLQYLAGALSSRF